MLEQIEQILNKEIRPLLAAHGGEMETLSFVDGVYRFRLRGQCADCPSASLTSETLIAQTLMNAVPQVKQVVLVSSVDDALIAQAKALLNHGVQENS